MGLPDDSGPGIDAGVAVRRGDGHAAGGSPDFPRRWTRFCAPIRIPVTSSPSAVVEVIWSAHLVGRSGGVPVFEAS